MWNRKPAATLIVALFASVIVSAQAPGTAPAITVEAQRKSEKMKQDINVFASSAIAKSWGESFMRWDHPVCPMVAGLNQPVGEFVLHRLSDIARSVPVPLDKENCKPNFIVVITKAPSKFIKILWNHKPRLFDTTHGIAPVKRFVELPRPVRIWYNSADIGSDGGGAYSGALAESLGIGLGSAEYPITVRPSSAGSRLTTPVVRNIESTLIIVDAEKIAALNIGQLVDYIALVGFAQINLDKDIGQAPSILKIFSATELSPPSEMTTWDKALLKSLYTTPQKDAVQLSEMETVMFRELSQEPPQ